MSKFYVVPDALYQTLAANLDEEIVVVVAASMMEAALATLAQEQIDEEGPIDAYLLDDLIREYECGGNADCWIDFGRPGAYVWQFLAEQVCPDADEALLARLRMALDRAQDTVWARDQEEVSL